MIRIVIVDDHPIVREGMQAMLESARGMVVVDSCESGDAAIEFVQKNGVNFDLMVMDIHMPGRDGFETLNALKRIDSKVRVLFLAGVPLSEEKETARANGAAGYLPKNVQNDRLIEAIKIAVQDGPFQEIELPTIPTCLTSREMQVLQYMALGKTREETSIILDISVETVKTHAKSIMTKLDASNTPNMISRAYALGILRP